jgi:hypothetical protein
MQWPGGLRIACSNSAWSMGVCPWFFYVVSFCLGRGLATTSSLLQGVLQYVVKNWSRNRINGGQGPLGLYDEYSKITTYNHFSSQKYRTRHWFRTKNPISFPFVTGWPSFSLLPLRSGRSKSVCDNDHYTNAVDCVATHRLLLFFCISHFMWAHCMVVRCK